MYVHPFVEAYIKRGIFGSLYSRWRRRLGRGFKILADESLAYLQYRVIDANGAEIDLKEEKDSGAASSDKINKKALRGADNAEPTTTPAAKPAKASKATKAAKADATAVTTTPAAPAADTAADAEPELTDDTAAAPTAAPAKKKRRRKRKKPATTDAATDTSADNGATADDTDNNNNNNDNTKEESSDS